MKNGLLYKRVEPDTSLKDFVESFWLLHNSTGSDKEIMVLPDGRLELTFSQSATEPFHIVRSGLETHPEQVVLQAGTLIFAISFRLPAIEYLFHNTVSGLLNSAEYLPADFWSFNAADLQDFNRFCEKASKKIGTLLPKEMDTRKQTLFQQLYASRGLLTVKDLAEKAYWSSRQMNRYFNQQFGISIKAYCNILRFSASLESLAQGRFFPDLGFADQSHFIKEIRKFTGVSPKELKRNHNDRFIQFSVLTSK